MAKTETLIIRISKEEKVILEKMAKEAKLSVTKFVYTKVFNGGKSEEKGEIVYTKPVNKGGRTVAEELALNIKIGDEMCDLSGTFIPNKVRNFDNGVLSK